MCYNITRLVTTEAKGEIEGKRIEKRSWIVIYFKTKKMYTDIACGGSKSR